MEAGSVIIFNSHLDRYLKMRRDMQCKQANGIGIARSAETQWAEGLFLGITTL